MAARKLTLGPFGGKGSCSSEWSMLEVATIVVVAPRLLVPGSCSGFSWPASSAGLKG